MAQKKKSSNEMLELYCISLNFVT